MFGYLSAKIVSKAKNMSPGVIAVRKKNKEELGLYFPITGDCQNEFEWIDPAVNIYVQDVARGSSFLDSIPFVFDTGTDVTIIPRKIIKRYGFMIKNAVPPFVVPVIGLIPGEAIEGRTFMASLTLRNEETGVYISFGTLKVVIVANWEHEFACLGFDALCKVITIIDKDNIAIWRNNTKKIRESYHT